MSDLAKTVRDAITRFNALSPAERSAHRAAQRASYIRGMTTPCEHGVLDFEQCGDCRQPTDNPPNPTQDKGA